MTKEMIIDPDVEFFNKISNVRDLSSGANTEYFIERLRITFKNGYGISIIKGFGSYGSDDGLYEIAPLNKNDDLDGSILGVKDDDVEGYLTKEDVLKKCSFIANIATKIEEE